VAIGTNLSADVLWYTVGRRGNIDRLFNQDGRFSKHQHRYLLLQEGMRLHATKILLLAKLSAGFALPTLIAAGLSGLSWRRWFPIVFIGETIWTGTLILIGFYFTEAIKQVEHGLQLIIVGFSFLFLLIIVWFIPRQMRNSELFSVKATKENESP
jgi:membrane protein DedA with SNARE-associated domain